MKNIRFTILFIWLSIYSVSAQINDVITFSINDIVIDTIGNYSKLSMPGCFYTDVIGYPFFRICNSEAVRPAFAMRDETKTTLKT